MFVLIQAFIYIKISVIYLFLGSILATLVMSVLLAQLRADVTISINNTNKITKFLVRNHRNFMNELNKPKILMAFGTFFWLMNGTLILTFSFYQWRKYRPQKIGETDDDFEYRMEVVENKKRKIKREKVLDKLL